MSDNIFSYVRSQRSEYETRDIPLFEGRNYSQYKLINQIDLYWADSYVDSADATDDVIGDFPFDNISKWRVLLEARATDFDRKHIVVEPDRGDREARVKTMIATKALNRYMRKIKFGKTINDLCLTRAKYGGVLLTKSESSIDVAPWQNLITDQSDIMGGVRILRHYFTPSQMVAKDGVWKNVKDALKTASEFRDKGVGNNAQEEAQTQGDLIEVFEIQGDMSRATLLEAQAIKDGTDYSSSEDDEYAFVPVKIIMCGADWVNKDSGEERGIVLYAEEEETTQKYLARNESAGRGLGEGIVENLFEQQKWHNFSKTEEVRMIAIAGKKLYWTDDPDILANIFDEGVDHGTVLRVGEGKTFQELNQIPTGTPIFSNMREEIDRSSDRITNSHASKTGEESKSGVPFRSQYLQNFEATSQFEQYREDIGFFLEEVVTDWILPDALAELAKEDVLYEVFSPQELAFIDEVIVNKAVTDEIVRRTLSREVLTPEFIQIMTEDYRKKLKVGGIKREIREFQDFIKDAGGQVVVHTTDEQRSKAVMFEGMSNLLALLAPDDPRRNALIDRIMILMGISKEELDIYMQEGILPDTLARNTGGTPKIKTSELKGSDTASPVPEAVA